MEKSEKVEVERIGGVPFIMEMLSEMCLSEKIDKHYPSHGNWEGLSKGNVVCLWLSYIIINCDHRLSYVSDWVASLEHSLGYLLGETVRQEDVSDDKLGHLLDEFSDIEIWSELEKDVNRCFIRAYDLNTAVVQLDPTIGKSFRKVIKEGLFQYGASKQFRQDLPQFKTILANLEEGNIPLTSITVSGEQADDVLYLPIINQAKASLDRNGILWVGDVKLGSLSNRASIVKLEDFYLSPLSQVQLPKEKLLADYLSKVLDGSQELEEISRNGKVIGQGYELSHQQCYQDQKWIERQLVVKSENYAIAQQKSLTKRLEKATKQLNSLNERKSGKKRYKTQQELQEAIAQILTKNKVSGLIEVETKISYEEKKINGYKNKGTRIERKMDYQVKPSINTQALLQQQNILGWRVYVTNQEQAVLSIEKAMVLYREEYKIERRIRNLKEEVTKLLPIFLKKEKRVKGLINLLMLALKIIAGFEYKVAQELAKTGEQLGGIYPGNPKITTANPTITKMMQAFKNFSLVFIFDAQKVVSVMAQELNMVQRKIIQLSQLKIDIFNINNSLVEQFNST